MNLLSSKRSEALTIILVIIIIAVFLGWFVNLASRECRSDNDCAGDYYCGSDFACHKVPVIEKTLVKNNLIIPSIIMGIAIIISAFILKSGRISFKRKKSGMQSEINEEGKHEGHETPKIP